MAGCASSGGTRPVAPVDSGKERPEPDRPPRPDAPTPRETPEPDVTGDELPPLMQPSDGYLPRHLSSYAAPGEEPMVEAPDDMRQIAILLPFSSSNPNVRRETEGLLSGIESLLFESSMENIVLIPLDTGGVPEKAQEAARKAVELGADVVLGPLFNHNVQVVAAEMAPSGTPLLAFSSDRLAGGNGAYLVSLPLEAEVARIIDWASLEGVTQFALMAPQTAYGRRVEAAMRYEVSVRGGNMIATQFYSPSDPTPTVQAELLAQTLNETVKYFPGQVAVLIPEQGTRLRAVAPLLPYYDVDIKAVKVLGTGQWNDPDVWREPSLVGGSFAAPEPAQLSEFNDAYRRLHGSEPTRLASMGYDAALLALSLIQGDALNRSTIENPDGFMGVNGLFRFNPDGTIERGLAVMQVTSRGDVVVVDPPRESFGADGF